MFLKSTVLFITFSLIYACEKYAFKKIENIELGDHVITTMTTPYVELCQDKCVWTMNCFSINVRNTRFGTVECDLNNSSNKASPESIIRKQGYQYYEMQRHKGGSCRIYECKLKKALANGWFRFNGYDFKMFVQNKTWLDARAHCMAMGGDLLSIETQYQSDFVYEVVKMTPGNTSWYEPNPWIGYNNINSTSMYKWSDGSISNFNSLMPLSLFLVSIQQCVAFENGKQWLTASCEEKKAYFCAIKRDW